MNAGDIVSAVLSKSFLVGVACMLVVMLFARRYYSILWWKTVILLFLVMASGLAGVYSMYRIESGIWGGQSYFGGVFLVPLMMPLCAMLLRIPGKTALDLSAPAVCVMNACIKIRCYFEECCAGRVLWSAASGEQIRFPSQISECVASLAIVIVLLCMMRNRKNDGKMYPKFMVFYGCTRFILNLFRETSPFVWVLPAGNFWALISIAIGLIWLAALRRSARNRYERK